eukprot:m.107817 g.107817  ORF g.107817 m.107817 type:complete len:77 (-) comp10635_c0_seq1:78-308(-)
MMVDTCVPPVSVRSCMSTLHSLPHPMHPTLATHSVVFLCVSTWVTLQDAFDGLEEEEKQSAANLCNATLRNEQHPP